MSTASKRNICSTSSTKQSGESSRKKKVHIVADSNDQAHIQQTQQTTTEQQQQQPEMSEQQFQMERMYAATSSSISSKPASIVPAESSSSSSSSAVEVKKDYSAEQSAFVNVGLARWLQTRKAWKGGKDAETAKQVAAAAIASSSSSSPSSSSSVGKTQLPHALSSHAHPSKKTVATRDGSTSEGEDEVGSTDQDEFVADDGDSDEDDGRDINADVPAILAAREHGTPFNPRVKLGHMVDILNVCWDEESD